MKDGNHNERQNMISKFVKDGVQRFVDRGIPPGPFLRAVLEDHLMEATLNADPVNVENLKDIVEYVNDHVPPEAYGSPEEVANWIAKHRKATV